MVVVPLFSMSFVDSRHESKNKAAMQTALSG